MNKFFLYFITISTIVLFSCKRYGNDPLTLRTPLNRITGTWEMTKYEIDGVDSLGLVNLPYEKMIFYSKMHYKPMRFLTAYGSPEQLYWHFTDNNQKVYISFTLFPIYQLDSLNQIPAVPYYHWEWSIDKLTNKEMILSTSTELPKGYNRTFKISMDKTTNKTQNDF